MTAMTMNSPPASIARQAREKERKSLLRNVSVLQSAVIVLAVALTVAVIVAWQYKGQIGRQGTQLSEQHGQISQLQLDIHDLRGQVAQLEAGQR